jgi:hypothetical protein
MGEGLGGPALPVARATSAEDNRLDRASLSR